jgi:hypothetical protein
MELVRQFTQEAYQGALEDWAWLDPVSRLTASFTSAFGGVFLKGDDGALWFLDTLNGTLEKLWPDAAAFQAALANAYAHDRIFMAALAQSAHEAGLIPGPTDILSFRTPPALGGAVALDNLEVSDFEVTLSFAGQIHSQVRHLPPGTDISGVSLATENGPGPASSRRLKFWRRNS